MKSKFTAVCANSLHSTTYCRNIPGKEGDCDYAVLPTESYRVYEVQLEPTNHTNLNYLV